VGTCFAESGNDVICVDNDPAKLRLLKRGECPIFEPGLGDLIEKNLAEGRLQFTNDLALAVRECSIIFLALPTPQSEDGSADLKHVLAVARQLGGFMNGGRHAHPQYRVIVNKSTVPVGTADKVREVIARQTTQEFDVVSNPEFLKEGAAVYDFMRPDRVVVGTRSPRALAMMQDLYAPFIRTGNPFIVMDERSAELTKYASNSFLAAKVSFMNEIANLCDLVGADVDLVRKGMGSDPRIGMQFLFAGVGYGGSCFPKDVAALLKTAADVGYKLKVVHAAQEANKKQKRIIVDRVKRHFKTKLKGTVLTIWGLSFKPNTDDIREAPSLQIINALLKEGAVLRVHDPEAMQQAKSVLGSTVKYFDNNYDALKGSSGLIVITEWSEFRRPDFGRIKSLMKSPVVFDGRNIYEPARLRGEGFVYYGIGRGTR
jgi:UDPglucose 6-dehydrogenase